jgi:thymidine kinase
VHAKCTRTGNLAQNSYRKTNNNDLVMLGEVDEYEPLSRGAFYKAMQRDKIRNLKVTDPEEVISKPGKTDV